MSALTDGTGAITVNVGGTVYMTTLATLTRVEGSMIGALAEALSDDEVLFIDRDGPSFRYVLNYLRDPFAKPLLPGTGAEREQLAREADFYGIPGLSQDTPLTKLPRRSGVVFNLPGPFVARRNSARVAAVSLSQNYELAFTMELASDWGCTDNWLYVLHVGNTYDQKMPTICFHRVCGRDQRRLTVHLFNKAIQSKGVDFEAGKTYEIKVVVYVGVSNHMTLYVDGVSRGSGNWTAESLTGKMAENASVFVGGTRESDEPAKVTLSNLAMTNCSPSLSPVPLAHVVDAANNDIS